MNFFESHIKSKTARHIGLFLPSLRGGGAERAMLELGRGFVQQGERVDLILSKAEGPYLAEVPREITVIDLGKQRVRDCLPGLASYLRHQHPEVILSTPSHANVAAVCASLLTGRKSRLIIREATTMSQSLYHNSWWQAWNKRQLVRRLYPAADRIVAVSAGVADDLRRVARLPKDKITVIYNPVVTSDLDLLAGQPATHPWLADQRIPFILAAGRLSRAKNFSSLIKAMALVKQSQPVRLIILGEGEYRQRLEELVAELGLNDHVSLPGFVSNPFSFMARSALLVLSSVYEGFPNVLVQAMALGIPVVATDCPHGPAEILEGGKLGRLVPVGDELALAQAIVDELRKDSKHDPLLTSRLKERASFFTQERAVREYSMLFSQYALRSSK